jgi:YbgC/YbaW family acyl-CoA thioester hydrolase
MRGAGRRSGSLAPVTHRFPIRVRFYELDPYGHVNHAVYIQYFEAARIELLREAGLTMQGMLDDGVMIVVTDIATRFFKPAFGNDDLSVETEVLEFRRVSSRWHQRLLRGDDVIVEQELGAAVTNLDGRPVRFPQPMVELLGPYLVAL